MKSVARARLCLLFGGNGADIFGRAVLIPVVVCCGGLLLIFLVAGAAFLSGRFGH